MQLIGMSGALRRESLNTKLLMEAVRLGAAEGVAIEVLSLNDYPLPLYDGDIEFGPGIPAPAQELGRRLIDADGLLLVSPEYNHSIPGTLKNTIDWVSRIRGPMPFAKLPVQLMSASPSTAGGARGLEHLRRVLDILACKLRDGEFSLPEADKAFDDDGRLKDADAAERVKELVVAFAAEVRDSG